MYDLTNQLAKGASVDGAILEVHAYVGERFLNLVYEGFSRAYIFSSKTRLTFLGPSPQVFKPPMPFKAYAAVAYSDGSPLSAVELTNSKFSANVRVFFRNGVTRTLPSVSVSAARNEPGVWELKVDLKKDYTHDSKMLADVSYLAIEGHFTDAYGVMIRSPELKVFSTFAPTQRLLQISTSTNRPTVSNYIVLHVRANYYVKLFSYVVVSKGIVLLTGREEMSSMLKTFTLTVSSEMSPTATILVYDILPGGEVATDSLTFPVDGITRNNFTVHLNNKKDKTGQTVEVAVYGRPGAYVALAALDKDLLGLQSESQLSPSYVQQKMLTFDSGLYMNNASLRHAWYEKYGQLDRFVYFPSPTIGIDANRTFEVCILGLRLL